MIRIFIVFIASPYQFFRNQVKYYYQLADILRSSLILNVQSYSTAKVILYSTDYTIRDSYNKVIDAELLWQTIKTLKANQFLPHIRYEHIQLQHTLDHSHYFLMVVHAKH